MNLRSDDLVHSITKDRWIELFQSQGSASAVAKHLDVNLAVVIKYLHLYGIELRKGRRRGRRVQLPPEEWQRLRETYHDSISIARQLDMNPVIVRKELKKAGIKLKRGRYPKPKTDNKRNYYLRLYKKYRTQVGVAKHLGVSREYARQILKIYNIPYDRAKAQQYFSHQYLKENKKKWREILQISNKKKSVKELAKEYSLSYQSVLNMIKLCGIKYTGPQRAASNERTRRVVDMLKKGTPVHQISKIMGMVQPQISYIRKKYGIPSRYKMVRPEDLDGAEYRQTRAGFMVREK